MDAIPFPYAGITQVRFEGCDLSLSAPLDGTIRFYYVWFARAQKLINRIFGVNPRIEKGCRTAAAPLTGRRKVSMICGYVALPCDFRSATI